MFTGIIEAVGKITAVHLLESGEKTIKLSSSFTDCCKGESISVNGVCLTADRIGATLRFFISSETLARTNFGELEAGSIVNLERALRMGDRLSGHLVQGHIDGLAQIKALRKVGESHALEIELSSSLLKYAIEKGSITLDGISLTVNSIQNSTLKLTIIPHTWANTNLSAKRPGQHFNIELDMVAKYVEILTRPYAKNS